MTTRKIDSKVTTLKEIVAQHSEESSFLWLIRDSAVCEPHYKLADLAKLDDRIEAHIDGLRIAGDEGWEICKEALSLEEVGEIFTAAMLAFESGIGDRIQSVIEATGVEYKLCRGLISALGWVSYEKIKSLVLGLLASESSLLKRIGLAACAVHRKDPGQNLVNALSDTDRLLQARALRAAGEFGRIDLLRDIMAHSNEEDENIRFSAAWSAALLGEASAASELHNIVDTSGFHSEKASAMALRRMNLPDAHAWLQALSRNAGQRRLAAAGHGVAGDPASVPLLIKMMEVPELARVAGESFSMIAGVDITLMDLEGEWPEGFEAGPTENPEDDDVAMDPDEDLTWPDPELISEWWNKNKARFHGGTRYLCGKPISEEQCRHVLVDGYQRQRAAAAIELAIMNPGQPLFEVRAPGFRQQKMLGLK